MWTAKGGTKLPSPKRERASYSICFKSNIHHRGDTATLRAASKCGLPKWGTKLQQPAYNDSTPPCSGSKLRYENNFPEGSTYPIKSDRETPPTESRHSKNDRMIYGRETNLHVPEMVRNVSHRLLG